MARPLFPIFLGWWKSHPKKNGKSNLATGDYQGGSPCQAVETLLCIPLPSYQVTTE